MSKLSVLALLAVAGAASVASASAVGNIVFTSKINDAVMYYDNGTVSTLASFSDPDVRLGDILRGPEGQFFVSSGPFPVDLNNNKSAVYKIDNLWSSPSISTLSSNYPLANPSGLAYHAASRTLLTVNNAQSQYNPVNPIRGVLNVNIDSGSTSTGYNQPSFQTPPVVWRTADDLVANPYTGTGNDYYAICLNGGDTNYGPADNEASTIWKYSVNPNTLVGTPSLLVNFADTGVTGLSTVLNFVRSATIKESTREMFLANGPVIGNGNGGNGIYRMVLDANGNFQSVSLLVDTLTAIGPNSRPDKIRYNSYTNKVVFSDESNDSIYQVNPDGTGLELVTANAGARGFYFIPTPGAAAILGLAGLAAARRRRA